MKSEINKFNDIQDQLSHEFDIGFYLKKMMIKLLWYMYIDSVYKIHALGQICFFSIKILLNIKITYVSEKLLIITITVYCGIITVCGRPMFMTFVGTFTHKFTSQ